MKKELLEELKQKLETERDSVQKQLENIAKKDDIPKGDWETRFPNRENGTMEEEADEVQEYDNLLPVEHSLELKLKAVNDALGKIPQGTYGKCENCGKEIEEERLKAEPSAKLCMTCNNNK